MRAVKLTRIEQIGADRCGEQWIVDLQREIDSARSATRPARPDLEAGLGVAAIDAPRRRVLGLRSAGRRVGQERVGKGRARGPQYPEKQHETVTQHNTPLP